MVSFIRNVAFDAGDPFTLAQFWSGVVGHPVHPECGPGDEEVVIESPNGPRLFFQAVSESKTVKNRVHVCLRAGDRSRDEELERLLGLGATMVADHREGLGPGPGWVVLGDPEGNEFCVNA